jgi:hypothetical protein
VLFFIKHISISLNNNTIYLYKTSRKNKRIVLFIKVLILYIKNNICHHTFLCIANVSDLMYGLSFIEPNVG